MIVYLKVLAAAIGLLKMTGPFKGECKVRAVHFQDGVVYIDLPVNAETKSNAIHSLFWNSRQSHAVVQAEQTQTQRSLVRYRVLRQLTQDLPEAGTAASLSGWLGSKPDDFGFDNQYSIVTLPNGTNGWFFDNNTENWVIHIHGRRAGKGETLRNLQQFADLGYKQYVMSMKTDPKPDGLGKKVSKLGQNEWSEIEEAVLLANSSGARNIILFGWSQGAMMSGLFLTRSSHAKFVTGAIFDSPLLDYRNTMRFQAERGGYDRVLGDRVVDAIRDSKLIRVLGYRNVDVDQISLVSDALLPQVPVLVLYSMNDGHVAIEDVHRFAEMNGAVSLVEIAQARHCRLFNEDKATYTNAISSWLQANQI